MMQGIDVESAKALTSAIAKLRDTRATLQEVTDKVEGPLKEQQRYLKHALLQLEQRRDMHSSNVNELLRVLHDLNVRNAQLREQNRLSQDACLLVSVHGDKVGDDVEGQVQQTALVEADIVALETAKEEVSVKLAQAKAVLHEKMAVVRALRSQQAQQLLEQKKVENAADRVQLDNTAVRAILGNA